MLHNKEESIVISGISCRFPESENMAEFADHLLNDHDMVTEDDRRWEPGLFGLPWKHGKLKELSKFDAQFFGIHHKQANHMDPKLRILLEVAYEAILDAGVNPQTLRGPRTGVFVGHWGSETGAAMTSDPETTEGYTMTGCMGAMFANRLSYSFDFQGPSFTVDTACNSSLLALQLAVNSIQQDQCDTALVGGANLTLLPATSLQFMQLGVLSPRGLCQPFDANADGYVRSEGIAAILLQKSSVARRCYATVVHIKSNSDGYKKQGITFPGREQQVCLLKELYHEAGICPSEVAYIEAHGTGTQAGDQQEANALAEVFCSGNRDRPLLIGSVRSNMGHCEVSSGLASVAKVVIAMEYGYIPPTLHHLEPNPNIPALLDGRLKVVVERTKWDGGFVGINSFGVGGANTHVLLKSNTNVIIDEEAEMEQIDPKILCFAGRTLEAAETLSKAANFHKNNLNFHALLAELCNIPPGRVPARGYTLLDQSDDKGLTSIKEAPFSEHRPVWFIYSGMGSQWAGMGEDLMQLEIFRNAVQFCSKALRPMGVDPYSLIVNRNNEAFKNVMHSMVCITAIQIGLTDVLKQIGIKPDGILGHSTGEMGCGYCDGGLTLEQTILCSYYRGKSLLDGNFPKGLMAAVGMAWEEAVDSLPDGVFPVCHNGKDSVTVSGEEDKVLKVAEMLEEEGTFVRRVDCSGIPFHSPLIFPVKETMLDYFRTVIPNPKPRSNRWVSSSIPWNKLESELSRSCSAEYLVNNAMSPVLFYNALQKVPENAVTIEIAPHCLLQSILRRNLHSSCINVGLMKAKHEKGLKLFLEAVGQLYQSGIPVSVQRLLPTVQFPVPHGTPMISPLIKWDHTHNWPVINAKDILDKLKANISFRFDPFAMDSKDKYLLHNVINGQTMFPFAAYLTMAWQALCKMEGLDYQKTDVILEDVIVHRMVILTNEEEFGVMVQPGSGKFTISEKNSVVAEGTVKIADCSQPFFYEEMSKYSGLQSCEQMELNSSAIYKEFLINGHEYGPSFKSLAGASSNGDMAVVYWTGNWITFLDGMLQATLLRNKTGALLLPTTLQYIRINPFKHLQSFENEGNFHLIHMRSHVHMNCSVAGGVELKDLGLHVVPKRLPSVENLVVQKVRFVKHYESLAFQDEPTERESLKMYINLCQKVLAELTKQNPKSVPNGAIIEQSLKEKFSLQHSMDEMNQLAACKKDPTCTLIQLMTDQLNAEVTSNPAIASSNVANTLDTKLQALEFDKLWNQAWEPKTLKPLLDSVIENTPGYNQQCCALEPTGFQQVKLSQAVQMTYPRVKPQWKVICTEPLTINCDGLQETNIHVLEFSLESRKPVPESAMNFDLIALDRVLSRKKDIAFYLYRMKDLLKDDGFAVVCEPTRNIEISFFIEAQRGSLPTSDDTSRTYGMFLSHEGWMKQFSDAGYIVIKFQQDPCMITTLYLIRKRSTVPKQPTIVSINIDDTEEFAWVQTLQHATDSSRNAPESETTWLVSNGKHDTGILGLMQCLKEEDKNTRIRLLCDASLENIHGSGALDLTNSAVQDQLCNDLHTSVYRDGEWGNFVHMPVRHDELNCYVQTEHAYLTTLVSGDLGSLCWIESPNKYWHVSPTRTSSQQLLNISYAAINEQDVMLASGKIPHDINRGKHLDQDGFLGTEFSGWLQTTGQRTMGVSFLQPALATTVTVVVDEKMCWEIPESWTLIEAATVPIAYCTAYYALVICGHLKESDSILIHDPIHGSDGIAQAAISVALDFGCKVFATAGTEDGLQFLNNRFSKTPENQFTCCKLTEFEWTIMSQTRGRGVDMIIQIHPEENFQMNLRCLAQKGHFFGVSNFGLCSKGNVGIDVLFKNATFHRIQMEKLSDSEWYEIGALLQKGINDGTVQPLSSMVFLYKNVEKAFEHMVQGTTKKVLLEIQPENAEMQIPTPMRIQALRKTWCQTEHVYLITGGLGGVGLELAQWLIHRGSRQLVLTSRSGIKTGYQARCIKFWKEQGIKILISTFDVSKEQETVELIKQCQRLGPLGGIFHLAMVLRDGLFENQTAKSFQEVAGPKYWGIKNLDKVTRSMCGDKLKWFVTFSSMVSAVGNAGQTNYGWANGLMEKVIEQRRGNGYPGIAIQWGPIGDVGVVVEKIGDNKSVVAGMVPQRIASCFKILDLILSMNHPIVASYISAETQESQGKDRNLDIVEYIMEIIGVCDQSHLDMDVKLEQMGIDSLMEVNIKQIVLQHSEGNFDIKDIGNVSRNKIT